MNKNVLLENMYSYTQQSLEDQLQVMDELLNSEEARSEPSPEIHLKPPAKKSKTRNKSKTLNSEEDEQPVPALACYQPWKECRRCKKNPIDAYGP